MTDLARWLFTPGDSSLVLAAIFRFLVGFSALVLSARYRKDGNTLSAALALTLACWTLLGGLNSGYDARPQASPYAVVWLLLVYALFVTIVIRRARKEVKKDA